MPECPQRSVCSTANATYPEDCGAGMGEIVTGSPAPIFHSRTDLLCIEVRWIALEWATRRVDHSGFENRQIWTVPRIAPSLKLIMGPWTLGVRNESRQSELAQRAANLRTTGARRVSPPLGRITIRSSREKS